MESNNKLPSRIISPKSGRFIFIYGDAFKKLLKEGYTEEELLKNVYEPSGLFPIIQEDYKISLTGEVDTDKYLINQLDLKDLFQFYQTNKYVKNLVDNNKKLKELITLLIDSSIYDSETDSFDFKALSYVVDKTTNQPIFLDVPIICYTLKLLEERKTDEAMKIVDFYQPEKKLQKHSADFLHTYFYGKLFDEILSSKLMHLPYIFEDYFSIAPNNEDWSFIDNALEWSVNALLNWDLWNDISKLLMRLLKSAEITKKNKLFDAIVFKWNSWKNPLKELIIQGGSEADLKAFDDLQRLIDNHYKK